MKELANNLNHYLELDTIKMVEDTIKKFDHYPLKPELQEKLSKTMTSQALDLALNYLENQHKIIYDQDGRILWVAADNLKLKKLLRESIRVR